MDEEIAATHRIDDKKPTVGMEFASLDEAYEFYNRYAKETGFSVRKDKTTYRKGTKEIINKYYVCSKEGTSKAKVDNSSQRLRVKDREECNAKLVMLKKKSSTIWMVSQFFHEHSHPLTTPRRIPLLRSHRQVSTAKKQLSLQFSEVNIPMCQQISLLEVQAGGVQNMGCTERDLYNFQRDMRMKMNGHDVEMLIEHFKDQQDANSSFYYKTEVDEEGRLDRCFWADATARRAYGCYGDVVVFDTTYNTNKYDMKFAPFVGVNKHGQTIIFACAFLSHENTSSFLWVFDQFKSVMPGAHPQMIITDQATAIANAIAEVFPNTFHRLCIWHIEQKFSSKLDATSDNYNYKAFHSCIWDSETPEEFDSRWARVLEQTKN